MGEISGSAILFLEIQFNAIPSRVFKKHLQHLRFRYQGCAVRDAALRQFAFIGRAPGAAEGGVVEGAAGARFALLAGPRFGQVQPARVRGDKLSELPALHGWRLHPW